MIHITQIKIENSIQSCREKYRKKFINRSIRNHLMKLKKNSILPFDKNVEKR